MRVVVIWLLLAALLSALAAAQVAAVPFDKASLIAFCALYAAIIGAGVASSTAVGALRTGQVQLVHDDGAARWGLWRRAILPMIAASGAAAALAVVVDVDGPPLAMLLSSSLLAVILARGLTRVPKQVQPIERSRWRWLIVEGALPAALMAGVVGVVVGVVRFSSVLSVPPGALSRTLAGTCLCYLLLGLGGFAKAFHEHKAGVVVVVAGPLRGLPGPLFTGLLIAALAALVGPWVLPSIAGEQVGIVKGVVGVVVGGTLSLLGALAGHRASARRSPNDRG